MKIKHTVYRVWSFLLLAGFIYSPSYLCASLDTVLDSGPQDYQIVAKVNDHPITNFDLINRLSFVLYSSQTPRTKQAMHQLAPQILKGLIDEEIRVKEAAKHGVHVTKQQESIITKQLERNNKLPSGALKKSLLAQGIHYQTVLEQVKATVAWRNLVNEHLAPKIIIDEHEINQRLATVKAHLNKPRYHLSEIKLRANTPEQRSDIKPFAHQLVGEINKAPAGPQRAKAFQTFAEQFSTGASAANGGYLGWVHEGALKQPQLLALRAISKSNVTAPIRIRDDEYNILYLVDKRLPSEQPSMVESVELHQAFIPYPPAASATDKGTCKARLNTLKDSIKTTHDLATANQRLGGERPCHLGLISMKQLPDNMKHAVEKLKENQISMPVEVDGGMSLFMISKREKARDDLPSRLELMNKIRSEKLEVEERKYFEI